MVIFFGVILALLIAYAIHEAMEGTATVGIGLLGALVGKFVHDETNRPSNKVDLLDSSIDADTS